MAKAKKSGAKIHKPAKGVARATGASNKPATYLSKLCAELEKASTGLLFISESDHPYEFFTLPQRDLRNANDPLNISEFLSGIGLSEELIGDLKIPIDQLIEERTTDNFFPTIDDIANYYGKDTNDPKVIAESKRYLKLVALLNKRLQDVKVFRVGKVEIRCYVAGFAKNGNIAGLVTTSIET